MKEDCSLMMLGDWASFAQQIINTSPHPARNPMLLVLSSFLYGIHFGEYLPSTN